MDEDLKAEIVRLAGEAENIRPHVADIHDLAARLHARFPHRAEREIIERMKSEWQARGLSWDRG